MNIFSDECDLREAGDDEARSFRRGSIRACLPSVAGLPGRLYRSCRNRTFDELAQVEFESPSLARKWRQYFRSIPGSQYARELLDAIKRESCQ